MKRNVKLLPAGRGADAENRLGPERQPLPAGDKERVVLGTEGGELLIIEGSELKATMSTETGTGVCSLLGHSKVRGTLKVCRVLNFQDTCPARKVCVG